MEALYFIFWLVLCSHEEVLVNIICLDVLEDIKHLYSLIGFRNCGLETSFKCDNVYALIKKVKL